MYSLTSNGFIKFVIMPEMVFLSCIITIKGKCAYCVVIMCLYLGKIVCGCVY